MNPESCYFCGMPLDPRQPASEHLNHCASVLEECPERCGAYVPRRELEHHRGHCQLRVRVERTGSAIDEQIRALQESAWRGKVVSILGLLRSAVHEGEREVKELRDTLVANLQLTNEALRRDVLDELFEGRRVMAALEARVRGLEEKVLEQTRDGNDMRLELEMRCKLSKELVDKYNVLFDKVELLERKLQRCSEAVAMSRYQSNATCDCVPIGRLIWRIDNFTDKMQDAKLNDSTILSPVFHDRQFGYSLRLELSLNGLGHWKNRHVIGCLRVVDGKWDPLLEWPCVLRADVVLRDQDNPTNDLEKSVRAVKKRGEDESEHCSDLHMFIPHTTLSRHAGYTKGDALFLEIRVREWAFRGSTMSLV